MSAIVERARRPSPAPYPQGIACNGATMWVGSCATLELYGVNTRTWNVEATLKPPGESFGLVFHDDALYAVLGFGDDADDRYIYRHTEASGFSEIVECPDKTGAFLAVRDGVFFLSQAHHRTILTLDDDFAVTHTLSLDRRPVGMTTAGNELYLITADDDWKNHHLAKVANKDLHLIADIPFSARGLAFDGGSFWTTHRESSEIVNFSAPAH